MSEKIKRPRDINQLAKLIVDKVANGNKLSEAAVKKNNKSSKSVKS